VKVEQKTAATTTTTKLFWAPKTQFSSTKTTTTTKTTMRVKVRQAAKRVVWDPCFLQKNEVAAVWSTIHSKRTKATKKVSILSD